MILALFILIEVFYLASARPTFAEDSFYKGKTVRLVVGTEPGGGFDTYSRALVRHIACRAATLKK